MEKLVEKMMIEAKIDSLIEGANKFTELILSMDGKLDDPNLKIVFASGMVGYSCQAAAIEKEPINFMLAKLISDKKMISSEAIYNYLNGSVYNFLIQQFHQKFPNLGIPTYTSYNLEVILNFGNENYLIEKKFNPEKVFDFKLYSSNWEKFHENLIKYCKTPDEWPLLFTIALNTFLEGVYLIGGKDSYTLFFDIAFKNAIYVSKIPQI
jgi:hypothetical protein